MAAALPTAPLRGAALRATSTWSEAAIQECKAANVCASPDPSTRPFVNQQTMLRIKDPEASVRFYTDVLGMRLLKQYDFAQWGFSLYFMGYADPAAVPATGPERTAFLLRQPGTIELTHNHGSDETYVDGNGEAPFNGFGHIGLTVPDVYAASARFASLGVNFRKEPDAGGMKGLAFVRDPDGYSIEILAANRYVADPAAVAATQEPAAIEAEAQVAQTAYKMTQTMVRVKDPGASLKFYTEVLGMRLLNDLHFPEYKFSLYFVGYCDPADIPTDPDARRAWCFEQPAAVELTHNWGTEVDPEFKHANGNDEEKRGFGHIGLVVPDVYAACERFASLGVDFRKEPDAGGMKGLAFIRDPDGYSIEILNEACMSTLEEHGD